MASTWSEPPPRASARLDAESGEWPGTGHPDLRDAEVCTDGAARLVGVAVCAADGTATHAFLPGQTAHFCFEFETSRSMEGPIGGLELCDSSGLVIHGRTSLQDGTAVPTGVTAGSRLRFHLALRLDLAPGDYWFSLGLSSADQRSMAAYHEGTLTHAEMDKALRVHYRAGGLGPLSLASEPSGKLLHHGIVNLPGSWDLHVLPHARPAVGADRASSPGGPAVEHPGLARPIPALRPHLIYLASYPRSGNTWVRKLVEFNLDRMTSTLYDEGTADAHADQDRGLFIDYQNQHAPIHTRRRLAQNCERFLNEDLRRQLGGSQDHFFLKTHALPFERYLEGEAAVYIVRHPAASLWSYYNYLRTRGYPHLNMEEVIEGEVPFGSWSRHVEAWLDMASAPGPPVVVLRYEALGSDEARACHLMSRLTGLPRRSVVPFPGFSYWHQSAPDFYRSGGDEWRTHLTADQLRLVRRHHSGAAERLGYEV
jgi:hypothetical protein